MSRITSLSMLLDTTGNDFLAEEYGKVIENIQKATLSQQLKNTDLSGSPKAGTLEAKRFVNMQSQAYGTARAAGKGENIKVKPVTIPIDIDRELIAEVEDKDVALYGVDGLIQREISKHQSSMQRELERAFFTTAATDSAALTTVETEINKIAEAIIQQIESTKNDFIDGIDRTLISLVCDTNTYGLLRNFLDLTARNANVNTAAEEFTSFHGVKVYSSVYLPTTANIIGMVHGSIAQPVRPTIAPAQKIQLSNAYGFGLFFSYGTKTVTPDLMIKYKKA